MTGYARMGAVAGAATVLAGLSLNAVFADGGWLPYLVSVSGTVAVTGMALRALRAPVWGQALGLLAVLVAYLCLFFGPGGGIGGFLPTPGTLRALGDVAAGGFGDIAALSAPVPARPGLTLLTAAGLGLVAILVDLLAVALRRPSLAGAPLLAVYAVPVAVSGAPVGWYWFALGGLGYLWLLRTDSADRLRRWGRPFRPGPPAAAPAEGPPSPTGAVGVAFAAAALVTALLVPALLPSLSTAGLFSTGEGAGFGRSGNRNVETINPITRLKGDLEQRENKELLRVRTDDRDPFYLRLTTLDSFHRGAGWSQSPLEARETQRVSAGLPAEADIRPGLPGRQVTTSVQVRGLGDSPYLPIYAGLQDVDVKGDWRYEPETQTVFSVRTTTRDLSYRLRSYRADYRPALLAAAAPEPVTSAVSIRFAGVSPDPRVQPLVDRLTKGKRTPYAKALAINDHFSPENGFRYSLRTKQGTTGDALVDFLVNKQGYCEQYASAMAYLARQAGLPARVAIGFTRGERKGDHWSVGTRDAHAWVEIWFRDIGWVPFDPTPLGGRGNAVTLPYAEPERAGPDDAGGATAGGAAPGPAGSPPVNPKAGQLDRQLLHESGALPPRAAEPARTSPTSMWPAVGGGALLVVLLVLPAVARALRRRRRYAVLAGPHAAGAPVAAAHAAWDELLDTLTDLRTPVPDAETPRATAARIGELGEFDEDGRAAVRRLARAEERARYAPAAVPPDGLADAVGAVRRRLLTAAGRPAALRAAVVPLSVVEAASGWAGSAGGRVASRVHRLRPSTAR